MSQGGIQTSRPSVCTWVGCAADCTTVGDILFLGFVLSNLSA